MNFYTMADLRVGMSARFEVTVTEAHMRGFYALTGDDSPIHMDGGAAKARGYPGRVVYGMLGASFFSTLAGVHLPGANCLLHSVEAKFAKPVFVGDTLTVSGEISELHEGLGLAVIKAAITNQHGVKVTRGVIRAGVAAVPATQEEA